MKRARDPGQFRAAMKARGNLSLNEVAAIAKCAKGTVARVLDGHAVNPEIAVRLAWAVRRPVDELFEAAPSSNEQAVDEREAVA
jgi:hypothetical protein